MANPVWPPSLPQYVQLEGYDETLPWPVKRTRMQSGRAKQRRIGTAGEHPLQLTTDVMTAAQAATFEAFYVDTLKTGSLPFDWVHPRTQAVTTFRLTGPAKPIALAGGRTQYRLPVEIMP